MKSIIFMFFFSIIACEHTTKFQVSPYGLTPPEVREVISINMPAIKKCYDAEDKILGARILAIRFVIGAKGLVTESAVGKNEVSQRTASCVNSIFKAMIFPEPRGIEPVVVRYPLTFSIP